MINVFVAIRRLRIPYTTPTSTSIHPSISHQVLSIYQSIYLPPSMLLLPIATTTNYSILTKYSVSTLKIQHFQWMMLFQLMIPIYLRRPVRQYSRTISTTLTHILYNIERQQKKKKKKYYPFTELYGFIFLLPVFLKLLIKYPNVNLTHNFFHPHQNKTK